MPLVVNLEKAQASLTLCLQKAGVVTPPKVDMGILMDVSGSFEDEHEDGITNALMTRLVPWGLTFDPDRKLDVITFSDGPGRVARPGEINASNYENFVRKNIIRKVPGWNGGTDYSYAIEEALRGFGWISNEGKKAGFFGKLFGEKDEAPRARQRSVVICITDGDNNDKERTRQVLRASEARKDEVYFLFIGIANGGGDFPFLESIGDEFGNTGFIKISNLRKFVEQSDEELNSRLLEKELLEWLKQ